MIATLELADIKEFASVVGTQIEAHKRAIRGAQSPPTQGMGVPDPAHPNMGPEMWSVSGPNYAACQKAVKTLPPGYYTVENSPMTGIFLRQIPANTDRLIRFPDCDSDAVIEEIRDFWTKEDHFRRLGYLWKRGFLLFGPAGSGKTSTVQIVCQEHVREDGIVLYVNNPSWGSEALKLIRQIEPRRALIVVVEEIDAVAAAFGESDLLAMLDGEHQVDNVVFIATTNYPERLDLRIVNRPSRFDIVKKIGMPGPEARKVYLTDICPRLAENSEELDLWVAQTDGFSFAHLKELLVATDVFERPFDASVERLRMMMEVRHSSREYNENPIGFNAPKR